MNAISLVVIAILILILLVLNLSGCFKNEINSSIYISMVGFEIKDDKIPQKRVPVAIVVIEDHIREDALDTIEWFKKNNVAIKIISGDNPITVSEVARRAGVVGSEKYISLPIILG